MKLGLICPNCLCDHWLISGVGKSRCAICHPSKHSKKNQWPRMAPVNHADFIRKGTQNGKSRKPYTATAHRLVLSDIRLARCVAALVESIQIPGGRWQYRITPILAGEYKSFEAAKRDFLLRKLMVTS